MFPIETYEQKIYIFNFLQNKKAYQKFVSKFSGFFGNDFNFSGNIAYSIKIFLLILKQKTISFTKQKQF